ncbi:uncharacterized protein LOC110813879 [Carica papaya]|uniref:uncharacterized protein LOC110813879 n=1 Tax=Carica papaya TaxID=3649 RepID=UPI000B8C8CD3|nr:uncharacterized protein LOC110813879 [Carica papaya]
MSNQQDHLASNDNQQKKRSRKRHCLIVAAVMVVLLIILISMVLLILVLTVFKPRQPTTQILSATVDGIAPRMSFPVVNIQLNITLNLKIQVHNPNHATFKHGSGKGLLFYQNNQVGEADISPGLMPAMASSTIPCRLTLQLHEFASDAAALIRDVLAGQIMMKSQTRIPGRVTFLGIFKKHVIATSECGFIIDLPSMKVQKQDCNNKTKL